MKRIFLFLALLMAGICQTNGEIVLEKPIAGYQTVVYHPRFAWTAVPTADAYKIQISDDTSFTNIVDEDEVHAVIHRYVCDKVLPPATYYWRVADVVGTQAMAWSASETFTIIAPTNVYTVTLGMSLAQIQSLLNTAIANTPAKFTFEQGTYMLPPVVNGIVMNIKDANELIFDGNGSTFVIQELSQQLMSLQGSKNIIIANYSYHHEPSKNTAATIISVNTGNRTFVMDPYYGYQGVNYPWVVNQMFGYLRDKDDRRRTKKNVAGTVMFDESHQIDLGGGLFELKLRSDYAGQINSFAAGDDFMIKYHQYPEQTIYSCKNVTFTDFTTHEMLIFGGGNDEIAMLHLSVSNDIVEGGGGYSPFSSSWVTGNDRTGPWVEYCNFVALDDDGPNFNANTYYIEQKISDTEFALQTGPSWQNAKWYPGDTLLFWNAKTGLPIETVKTISVEARSNYGLDGKQRVVIDKPVTGTVSWINLLESTHVYNLDCYNDQVVCRNNTLIGGRRFGFFIKARNVLIENNYFEGLAQSPVFFENEPTGWEGIHTLTAVIQNNVMKECGYDDGHFWFPRAGGVHVQLKRHFDGGEDTSWIGHDTILIRNNHITDHDASAIRVLNAKNVTIVDNVIDNARYSASLRPGSLYGIYIDKTHNLTLRDNAINDLRAMVQAIYVSGNGTVSSRDGNTILGVEELVGATGSSIASSINQNMMPHNKMTVEAAEGQAENVNIKIWNGGTGTLNYTLVDNSSKYEFDVLTGSSTGSSDKQNHVLTVSDALSTGTYERTFVIVNDDTGESVTIDLFINVTAWSPFDPLGWSHTMDITFSGYTRNETLTNFPALIRFNDSLSGFLYSEFASPTGGDLRFTDAQTNELAYEIENWNTGGDSYVWVRVPTLSGTGDYIRVYWGNTNETTAPAYTTDGSTWSEGFAGVWHLNEGGTGTRFDSTANNNNGTPQGYTGTEATTGRIGGADDLDGSVDNILVPDHNSLDLTDRMTVSAWVKADAWSSPVAEDVIIRKSSGYRFMHRTNVTWNMTLKLQSVAGNMVVEDPIGNYTPGQWYHVAGTYDRDAGGNNLILYRNGTLAASVAGTNTIDVGTDALYIGAKDGLDQYFNGIIDEVRVSNVARSSNWIWACWMQASDGLVDMLYGGGAGDSDGDGMSDADELIAGTDPTNATSVFKITGMSAVTTNNLITWNTVTGKYYKVQTTTNLMSTWTNVSDPVYTNIMGSGAPLSFTNMDNTDEHRFFRVKVR